MTALVISQAGALLNRVVPRSQAQSGATTADAPYLVIHIVWRPVCTK